MNTISYSTSFFTLLRNAILVKVSTCTVYHVLQTTLCLQMSQTIVPLSMWTLATSHPQSYSHNTATACGERLFVMYLIIRFTSFDGSALALL